ncbi:MAG: amino acid adenylation domain-containing protein [Solirubrobacterales bacterium]|nr:amino acid adenylation domain-containing protein [Solirubrobacterales bacterium]
MSSASDNGHNLARRLAALSPERRAAVERLLGEGSSGLVRVGRGRPLPLSFGQQRLWFLAQLDPESWAYNTASSLRMSGVDVGALRWALEAVVGRHESLRTTFVAVDGEPFQQVSERVEVPLVVREVESFERARVLAGEFARRPFDLGSGPLLRAALLRVAARASVLVVCVHHIVTDGWSMGVFFSELSALYNARVHGREAGLAPLPIQYADFAVWQRRQLQGPRLAELLAFWRQELEGLSALELPTDHPRPAAPSFRGASVPLVLEPALTRALRELAARHGATMFMALTAAFAALLARYSGQHDIAIGTPVAGRSHSQLEPLIGFFVNTIVLRCELSGDPSYRQLLERTRQRALHAYAHQDLPFEKLVEELGPQRDLTRNPLFQALVHVHDSRLPDGQRDVPSGVPQPVERDTSAFDLALDLWDGGDTGVRGRVDYSTELFERGTVERMVRHFGRLLAGAVADPDAPVSRLEVLSPAEREWELVKFNQTARPGLGMCVHELIDTQAGRTPEAPAVIDGARRLSYRELTEAANALAHALIAAGAGPDRLIAVRMPRSLELIIAQLGILKAGAAYLPLDPTDPNPRQREILSDAQPLTVLNRLPELAPRPDPPATAVQPGHLAYAIYTSGSTGTPKGTLIEHHSLTNLVSWHVRAYDLMPEDRAALTASPAFDASTWEIWPHLAAGASIHIPVRAAMSPAEMVAWLVEQRITTCFLATPLAEAVMEESWPQTIALRRLLTGGDRLHRPPRAGLPFELVNHYGPTECAVVSTACPVPSLDVSSNGSAPRSQPPIGLPIDNVQAFVLDQHQQPVPAGRSGELHIGGEGLARGYLNRPELTARQFITAPYPPFERLYRTGDLVRRLPDGNLEYIGRLDDQIKLRGFRIEPGEIDAALLTHPRVRAAATVLREDRPGDPRLISYAVVSPGGSPAEIREHLRERLPDYMLPAQLVTLPRLPTTTSGKIDKSALPAPPTTRTEHVPPRTDTERTLGGIWQSLLQRDAVGIFDNFFDLGGHSLLAVQLLSRIRVAFAVELSLRELFDAAMLADLAAAVDRAQPTALGATTPITRVARERYRVRVGEGGGLELDGALRDVLQQEMHDSA